MREGLLLISQEWACDMLVKILWLQVTEKLLSAAAPDLGRGVALELMHAGGQGRQPRSYPMPEVRGHGREKQPSPEVRGGGKRSNHTPKVRGGGREEEPHVQGAAAALAQEG